MNEAVHERYTEQTPNVQRAGSAGPDVTDGAAAVEGLPWTDLLEHDRPGPHRTAHGCSKEVAERLDLGD